jgi:large conductance mechanosensitive channel
MATGKALAAKSVRVKKADVMATPTDPTPKKPGFGGGFMDFIRQYNVIPLAIAVVLGNALNDVIKVVVEGIITPFISLVSPTKSIQHYEWTVHNSTFQVGAVLSAIITFLVIAIVVYVFAKRILHDESLLKK